MCAHSLKFSLGEAMNDKVVTSHYFSPSDTEGTNNNDFCNNSVESENSELFCSSGVLEFVNLIEDSQLVNNMCKPFSSNNAVKKNDETSYTQVGESRKRKAIDDHLNSIEIRDDIASYTQVGESRQRKAIDDHLNSIEIRDDIASHIQVGGGQRRCTADDQPSTSMSTADKHLTRIQIRMRNCEICNKMATLHSWQKAKWQEHLQRKHSRLEFRVTRRETVGNPGIVEEDCFLHSCNHRSASEIQPPYMTLKVIASSPRTFVLNDGNAIPAVALGTSLGHLADGTRVLPVNHSLAHAVQWALEAGYRHIDTAALYLVEDEVGLGVKNYTRNHDVDRKDIFITTKLWNDAHNRDDVIPALRKSLNELQMEYVDLYLMHYPMAYNKDGSISLTDYLETWKGLEDAKGQNLTRSIGVSNFNLTQMQRLWNNSLIKPAVLQIEVNPSITQDELVDWCNEHGVLIMAYSPFGAILGRKKDAPSPRADHPVLQRLALKYNKTVPQILIRYLLDRDMIPIPRSTNKERINQNIDVFEFSLTPREVAELSAFNSNYRLRTPAKWYPHPHFPFEKKPLTDEQIQYIIEHSKED